MLSHLFGRGGEAPAWIDIADLQGHLADGGVLLVDVRQPEEYGAPPGHLPGAINVPLGQLSSHIAELAARQQPIILVCQTDRRSARAAAELLAAGVHDLAVLARRHHGLSRSRSGIGVDLAGVMDASQPSGWQ
jgi:rhodanese-related sulfurtransferase